MIEFNRWRSSAGIAGSVRRPHTKLERCDQPEKLFYFSFPHPIKIRSIQIKWEKNIHLAEFVSRRKIYRFRFEWVESCCFRGLQLEIERKSVSRARYRFVLAAAKNFGSLECSIFVISCCADLMLKLQSTKIIYAVNKMANILKHL